MRHAAKCFAVFSPRICASGAQALRASREFIPLSGPGLAPAAGERIVVSRCSFRFCVKGPIFGDVGYFL